MKINKDIIKNLRLIVFIVIVLNLGMAFAEDPPAPPTTINFQGYLTDNAGEAIDGTKDIKISVYEVATGGSDIYEEKHEGVTIDDGRFNVSIGGGTALDTHSWPDNIDFTKPLWIQITIDPDGTPGVLSPRTPLTPAPYAQIAINDSLYSVEKAGCNNSQYVKRNSSDDGWECADLAVTLDGTETLENKTLTTATLTTPVITLQQGSDVSGNKTEGQISWDSDDDKLYVGKGDGVVEIGSGWASSLSGLSDVGTATATSGNILIADGTNWDSVAVSQDATLANDGKLTIANDAVTADKIATNAVTSAKIDDGTIANADISAMALIEYTKLKLTPGSLLVSDSLGKGAALDVKTSGQILVGDGTDLKSVAVSGDATLASDGTLTIAADAVDTSEIKDDAVTAAKIGQTCSDGQVLKNSGGGTAWICADDNSGSSATTIAARAYATAATSIDTSFKQITFGGETYDTGGDNFASNAFTAPSNGYYLVNSYVELNAQNMAIQVGIYVNGTAYALGTNFASFSFGQNITTGGVSDTIYLDAGDVVTIWAIADGTIDCSIGSAKTFVSIIKLGS